MCKPFACFDRDRRKTLPSNSFAILRERPGFRFFAPGDGNSGSPSSQRKSESLGEENSSVMLASIHVQDSLGLETSYPGVK